MKLLLHKLSKQICLLSESLGVHCCWKHGSMLSVEQRIPELFSKHRCAFCDAVKTHPGAEERCRRNDTLVLSERMVNSKGQSFIGLCPAGACDLVVPFLYQGEYLGAVLVGPFRLADQQATCEKILFERLPLLDRKRIERIAELVKLVLTPLVEQIYPDNHPNDSRFAVACEYLRNHLSEKLSAAQVAHKIGLSRSRFLHCFAQQCGRSFAQELLHIRVEHAREQMCRSEATLEAIAVEAGFTNQSHFTAAFKREYGVTPHRWRQAFFAHQAHRLPNRNSAKRQVKTF